MSKSGLHLAVFYSLGLGVSICVAACQTSRSAAADDNKVASATGVVAPPPPVAVADTPAGRAYSAWLTAFNAADRDRLKTVLEQFRETRPIESTLGFRRMTGGFDLMKVLESTPTRLRVWLRQREGDRMAEGQLEVEPQPPHYVVSWKLRAIPTPDEYLTADQRARSSVDEGKRRRLLDGIARVIEANYVFPEVAQRMIAVLRDHAARGDYDKLMRGDALSAAITKDLREVSRDLHLRVAFGSTPPPPSERPRDERLAHLRTINFGFGPIHRLPGNVAHLVINGFVPAED